MSMSRFLSFFSTFLNNGEGLASVSLPSTSLASGASQSQSTTIQLPADVENVVDIRVKFDGLDTFWREAVNSNQLYNPSFGTPTWYYGMYYKISGNVLTLSAYIYNNSGGTLSSPAMTVYWDVDFFIAPFQS